MVIHAWILSTHPVKCLRKSSLTTTTLHSYLDIDRAEWDALLSPSDCPFLEHTFLSELESTGCAIAATGWLPRPVVVRDAHGALVGAAPAWVKRHSMGEFVYDHAWADAAQRAGFAYYPKLVVGVPFTPATGRRLLVRASAPEREVLDALVQGIVAASGDTTGVHVLFHPADEADVWTEHGFFPRLQYQFHWHNQQYETFSDYLGALKSKTRANIRRERRALQDLDITVEVAPSVETLRTLHRFHTQTVEQFGPWGRVYLSAETFQSLGDVWGHRLHAVVARQGGEIIAGALNVLGHDTLYGRYWACGSDRPFLHFEVCYYQAVEDAIARGLRRFEPGHGGGHKYRRGFEPVVTWSSHRLHDPRLHEAFERHAVAEASAVRAHTEALAERCPIRGRTED